MPHAEVYEYVGHDGSAPVSEWIESLQKKQRAKLKAKIQALRQYGGELPTTLLSDTSNPHIKKLRVRGNVQLRPLLCRGPASQAGDEFTLLAGATERDGVLAPATALADAETRRTAVIADLRNRRRLYVS
jgi:hypothetical protein